MRLFIWYSPIPSYFCLFIIFLPPLSLCHAPHWCNLLHDSCELSQPPSTIPYTHHTISPAPCFRFGIWLMDHTVLFPISSSFQLPDAPCHGPTGHKPLRHVVRALSPVSPHMNLVLVFVYHLYLDWLWSSSQTFQTWSKPDFEPGVQESGSAEYPNLNLLAGSGSCRGWTQTWGLNLEPQIIFNK